MPYSIADLLLRRINEHHLCSINFNLEILESILGLDPGTFSKNGGVVRIDIYDPLSHNIRLPSGNEYGANSNFIPGGRTSGGALECVIDNVPNSDEYRGVTLDAFSSVESR